MEASNKAKQESKGDSVAEPIASSESPAPLEVSAERDQAGPGEATADLAGRTAPKLPAGPLPIRMLSDRLLVMLDAESGDRRSKGGILIPVTAEVGKRLAWAFVVATGMHVRQVKVHDRILFDPADRAEVELSGQTFLLLRERDVHGVYQDVLGAEATGLYL